MISDNSARKTIFIFLFILSVAISIYLFIIPNDFALTSDMVNQDYYGLTQAPTNILKGHSPYSQETNFYGLPSLYWSALIAAIFFKSNVTFFSLRFGTLVLSIIVLTAFCLFIKKQRFPTIIVSGLSFTALLFAQLLIRGYGINFFIVFAIFSHFFLYKFITTGKLRNVFLAGILAGLAYAAKYEYGAYLIISLTLLALLFSQFKRMFYLTVIATAALTAYIYYSMPFPLITSALAIFPLSLFCLFRFHNRDSSNYQRFTGVALFALLLGIALTVGMFFCDTWIRDGIDTALRIYFPIFDSQKRFALIAYGFGDTSRFVPMVTHNISIIFLVLSLLVFIFGTKIIKRIKPWTETSLFRGWINAYWKRLHEIFPALSKVKGFSEWWFIFFVLLFINFNFHPINIFVLIIEMLGLLAWELRKNRYQDVKLIVIAGSFLSSTTVFARGLGNYNIYSAIIGTSLLIIFGSGEDNEGRKTWEKAVYYICMVAAIIISISDLRAAKFSYTNSNCFMAGHAQIYTSCDFVSKVDKFMKIEKDMGLQRGMTAFISDRPYLSLWLKSLDFAGKYPDVSRLRDIPAYVSDKRNAILAWDSLDYSLITNNNRILDFFKQYHLVKQESDFMFLEKNPKDSQIESIHINKLNRGCFVNNSWTVVPDGYDLSRCSAVTFLSYLDVNSTKTLKNAYVIGKVDFSVRQKAYEISHLNFATLQRTSSSYEKFVVPCATIGSGTTTCSFFSPLKSDSENIIGFNFNEKTGEKLSLNNYEFWLVRY